MLIVEGNQLADKDELEEIISEAIKMSISTRLRSKIASKRNRQKLLENFGEKAFLLPDRLKFPIMNPDTGELDCSLLYAAMIRAKQYAGVKPGYMEIYQKAKRLFNQQGCKNKVVVRIHDNDEPTDIDLKDILEIFS